MNRLSDYGLKAGMLPEHAKGIPARVTAVHKSRYALVCEHGETFGRLKASIYYSGGKEAFPACGDFVLLRYNPDGDSQIIKTLDRISKFSRTDFSGHAAGYAKTIKEQVIAANFDTVFIMQSLNHDMNLKRLERYLALTWQSGAQAVVLLTKADLLEVHEKQLEPVRQTAAGKARVIAISARTGYGLEALKDYLKPNQTIVCLGSSGVGKSSLVNVLAEEERMTVKGIREDDSKGRHTTTHRQLIRLQGGAMLIDTPGMRELGMWEASDGLRTAFQDVEQYFGLCKFRNCSHNNEPGCAILAAIKDDELPSARWESYKRMIDENMRGMKKR